MKEQNLADQSVTPSVTSRIPRHVLSWLFTIISILGALVGIYTWIDGVQSKPLVRLNVVDSQCLTRLPSVPSLCSTFNFNGHEVKNLWATKISLVNDCRRNIIGLPGHDMMYPFLEISVTNKFMVIMAELEKCDFDVCVSNSVNSITLSYSKWRPGQVCVIKLYLEGGSDLRVDELPKFILSKDPFTQGELIISDYQAKSLEMSLLKRLPYWVSKSVTWIGILLHGVLFLGSIWFFFRNWILFCRRVLWNLQYKSKILEMKDSSGTSNESVSDIPMRTAKFWKENNIPFPPINIPYWKGWKIDWEDVLVTHCIIFLIILISAIPLLAMICL